MHGIQSDYCYLNQILSGYIRALFACRCIGNKLSSLFKAILMVYRLQFINQYYCSGLDYWVRDGESGNFETGKTAQEYLQLKVIDVAKRLFDQGKSVSQIAYELGFKYPRHFARLFKQWVGQSQMNTGCLTK